MRCAYAEAMVRKVLLVCGILSSLLYVGRDLAALLSYPGYDFTNQVVSELSAIGVPSRGIDIAIGRAYGVLMIAFGVGLWLSADGRRGLRVAGMLLVVAAVYGTFWPPMHMRGSPPTITDTLHIAWTGGWLFFTMAVMGSAAGALGKRFQYFTAASIAVILVFGMLTELQAPQLGQNLPTPGIGVVERINIGAFLLWIAVLALELWPRGRPSFDRLSPSTGSG